LKDVEEALRARNEELERLVVERTRALELEVAARRAAEAQFEAVIASMTDGLMVFDDKGTRVSINDATLRLLGVDDPTSLEATLSAAAALFELEDLEGRTIPVEAWPVCRALRGEAFTGCEVKTRRKDTAQHWILSYSATPVRDGSGEVTLCVVAVRDVTAQKQAEQEREMLLDSERAARAEAQRASRLKDEFLATLSHELRTPLTAILGWASILRKPDVRKEQIERGLAVIERNTRAQVELISDLLDVSRIVTGKLCLDVAAVEIDAVIDNALESVRHAAEAKGIQIKRAIGPSMQIPADAGRLQQVVWNLLSNAIKFTPRGGRVEVSVATTPTHVEIAVADTGQGVAPEFLPHVFERFRQADASMARQHGGLGLGLAIVRHLVELHGGRVRAESEGAGKGARFVVELPVGANAEARAYEAPTPGEPPMAHPPAPRMPPLEGVKVLVVEDEADTRELVRILLEECKAEVVTAASGPAALEMLAHGAPDVLVSDIGMPGMDGYALIRAIRVERALAPSRLPAVALTAFARPEDKARALSAGYQSHLAKPVEPKELISTIASLSSARGSGPR
jgi:signal transduction histidine kinase/CheY-like chemotaxis protein